MISLLLIIPLKEAGYQSGNLPLRENSDKSQWELILKVYNEMLNDRFIALEDEKKFLGISPKSISANAEKVEEDEEEFFVKSRKSFSAIAEKVEDNEKSFCAIAQKVLYQETLDDLPRYNNGKINYSVIAKTKVFESVFKVQNRGKLINRGIWANLFIMLDLAQWLDVDLRYEIYKTFIDGKILIHRDNGGEEFKRLNALIDTLPDRIEKANKKGLSPSEANKGAYIAIAKLVNEKVKGSFTKGWNEKEDITEFQAKREKLLNFLCSAIEMRLIQGYDQLKATITNFRF